MEHLFDFLYFNKQKALIFGSLFLKIEIEHTILLVKVKKGNTGNLEKWKSRRWVLSKRKYRKES